MPAIGKFAQGLRGFPSPNEPAGTSAYLLVYLPDLEWSQYLLGALLNLTQSWNWYEAGDLAPDVAADMFRQIVAQAPLNKLPSCSLPTGEPLMRVDPSTGNIQGVDGDGNWQDDPSIPPPPPRPDEPGDQLCLGVANTANALQILYENLTDSWAAGLSTAEAASAFVTTVGTAITAELAPPVAALIAIGGLLFQVVYQVVEWVGADVWTEEFNGKLLCVLYSCASIDGDRVVTYDFQCILDGLADITDLDLSFAQLRLFGQLYYILSFIGADGLNHAASATAIVSADCSPCVEWEYEWDLTVTADGWHFVDYGGDKGGTWVSGQGFLGEANGGNAYGFIYETTQTSDYTFDLTADAKITRLEIVRDVGDSSPGAHQEIWVGTSRTDGLANTPRLYTSAFPASDGADGLRSGAITGLLIAWGTSWIGTPYHVQKVRMFGSGARPTLNGGNWIT